MKKFFAEFKKFISKGKVVDLAVGVIIGSAFTAIVTALSNWILKPIINWLLALILGANSLSEIYTFLKWVPTEADPNVVDLTASIYIDWGAFINAIINFLLIAIVLFLIVKLLNRAQETNNEFFGKLKKLHLNKEEKAELVSAGVNVKDKKAVLAYYAKKEEQEKLEKEAKEKAEAEEAKKHTTEGLLEQIKELLEKQVANK